MGGSEGGVVKGKGVNRPGNSGAGSSPSCPWPEKSALAACSGKSGCPPAAGFEARGGWFGTAWAAGSGCPFCQRSGDRTGKTSRGDGRGARIEPEGRRVTGCGARHPHQEGSASRAGFGLAGGGPAPPGTGRSCRRTEGRTTMCPRHLDKISPNSRAILTSPRPWAGQLSNVGLVVCARAPHWRRVRPGGSQAWTEIELLQPRRNVSATPDQRLQNADRMPALCDGQSSHHRFLMMS